MANGQRSGITLEALEGLMRFKPTKDDCAAFFKCSASTIDLTIKELTGLTYKEFRERGMIHVRLSLVQKAMQMAHAGDRVMLIFCLKNLCGWNDNPTSTEQIEIPRAVISVIGQKPDADKKSV